MSQGFAAADHTSSEAFVDSSFYATWPGSHSKKIAQEMYHDVKTPRVIVFDLDDTLVKVIEKEDWETLVKLHPDRAVQGKMNQQEFYWIVRDFWEILRKKCWETFDAVGVYSSGHPEYVKILVKNLFKDKSPDFVLASDSCKDGWIKLHDHISDRVEDLFPERTVSRNTILIVDDRPEVYSVVLHNGIYRDDNNILKIPPFQPVWSEEILPSKDASIQLSNQTVERDGALLSLFFLVNSIPQFDIYGSDVKKKYQYYLSLTSA